MTMFIRIFRYTFFTIGCIFFTMILAGCSGYSHRNAPADSLRVAVSVEVSSLDPQITSSVGAIKIQSALFENLVNVDSETGQITPAATTHWDVSDDGLTYRFYLRKNLKWSDGSVLNSEDFKSSILRIFNPELAPPFANLYFSIVGAEGVFNGEIQSFTDVGVKAPNEHELVITLREPVPYFLSLLARPCMAAIPTHWIEEKGGLTSRLSRWSLDPGFPTSGPYVLEEWIVNKWIRLVKNDSYWDADHITVNEVIFFPIESAYTQELAFRSGTVDVTSTLAAEFVSKYQDKPSLMNQLEMGTYYVIANTQSESLESVPLRVALSRAVNRQGIVRNIRKRGEQAAYSFCPPLWGNDYPVWQESDIPNEHQWDKSGSDRSLKLLISSSENNNLIAEALQEMWESQLGIHVEIYRQEWKSYLDSRNRGLFDLCLATWIGDYFDPLTFLEMWHSDSPNNFCQWHDSEYDFILGRSYRIQDYQARLACLKSAENRLMAHQPIIPLFYLGRVFLRSEDLNGWPQSILNSVDYSQIRLNRN